MDLFKRLIFYDYIPKNIEHRIRNYKYKGGDDSWIYTNIIKKISLYQINLFIPEWVAPNLITFIGLFCVLLPHLIITYWYPYELNGDISQQMSFLIAILHLSYMNSDNLDGIQARKTDNASPLGLLVDHGCDANTVYLQAFVVATQMRFGNTIQAVMIYLFGSVIFYLSTLEQYLVQELILPPIDFWGQLSIVGLFLFSGIQGQTYWTSIIPLINIPVNQFIFNGYIVIFIVNLGYQLIMLKKRIDEYNKKENKNIKFSIVFQKSACFLFMVFSNIFILYFSRTNVFARLGKLLMYIQGMNISQLVSRLHISHVVQCEFNQWRLISIVTYALLILNCLFLYMDEDMLIYILLTASLLSHFHLWINIFRQFTTVLGIKLLKVKEKTPYSNGNHHPEQNGQNGIVKEEIGLNKTRQKKD